MKCVLRIAMLAALAVSACRRPAPEDPWAWEKNPGLDPHPTGQTLQGQAGPALPEVSFRLDPARGTSATLAATQPTTSEEELYLKAARSGQAWAQVKLGMKYVMKDDIARLGEGLFWLNAAADQNNTEALRVLAMLAMEGRGVDQSDKDAYRYLRRAADLGSPEAQHELAKMLANGQGMPRDMEAALIWWRKAAEQNYAPAQFAVAQMLIGSVEQQRRNEGLVFVQQAADAGRIDAVIFLAMALIRGEFGLAKDEARAESMLRTYAENGKADCQFALALLYRNGEMFADRRGEAQEWLRRAAESGHPKALEALRKGSSPAQP
jgi:TPR repeat protein